MLSETSGFYVVSERGLIPPDAQQDIARRALVIQDALKRDKVSAGHQFDGELETRMKTYYENTKGFNGYDAKAMFSFFKTMRKDGIFENK